MLYSKEFFDLNLRFARRISEVTGQNLERSLLDDTHLYLALGLGRDFDPGNSIWRDYLCQMRNHVDQAEYTHRLYLERTAQQPKQKPDLSFGCFSCALWDYHRVRLHFHDATREGGVLRKVNILQRMAELKVLFEHLKKIVPATATVVGGSWLYNIEAYRRLFPEAYLKTAQAAKDEFQFIALWGQFLFHDGTVRLPMTQSFLEGIKREKTLEGVTSCFPYPVLRLESSIEDFYVHYGVA